MAELYDQEKCHISRQEGCQGRPAMRKTYQTTPYAPSPTTSWISYCSLTLKEILREVAGFGGLDRDMVDSDFSRVQTLCVAMLE